MRVVACRYCATIQGAPETLPGVIDCAVCAVGLERFTGRSLDAALATAIGALLLLLPANGLTFLTTTVFGAVEQSRLASSVTALWAQGSPPLALLIGLVVIVFPILRFSLLTTALGCLKLGVAPRWLGRCFRWSNDLQTWAMIDVFLLAFLVAYARLAATITVIVGPGCFCFLAAGLLTLLNRAMLDKKAIWSMIMAEPQLALDQPTVSCDGCELLVPLDWVGRTCPRCDRRLRSRKTDAIGRSEAFLAAGAIFYAPANLLPIATIPINLRPTSYNIIGGVHDLVTAGLYGLAALVFVASFLIPILKFAALAWVIHSVRGHSRRFLRTKTRIFQLVDEIGRWSMVDPLVIACFVPVVHYNTLLTARAEAAAPFFAGVVVLTIFAAKAFDPRLIWDAAEAHR